MDKHTVKIKASDYLVNNIENCIRAYEANPEINVFPLDEVHFKGLYLYINKKPKTNPFPLGTYNDYVIYLGGPEE
jgi:hypothetical protein